MIGWLIAQFATLGLPEPLRKAAAWASVALAVLALLWSAKAIYDASVIADHEKDRAVESMDAHDDAAEKRASDTIANTANEKDLHDAIDTAPTGGALSPAARALSCERLCKRGSPPASCRPHCRD